MTSRTVRSGLILMAAAVSAGAVACASAPVVPLRGPQGAIASLVGEWDGHYSSRQSGRSGSIWFRLIAGEDHAHGDVLMTPHGGASYTHPGAGSRQGEFAPVSQLLTIRFVRVTNNEVRGALDPYWDPACQCQAVTTFHGYLSDDRLRGTFITRPERGLPASGEWTMTRRRFADH